MGGSEHFTKKNRPKKRSMKETSEDFLFTIRLISFVDRLVWYD